VLRKKIFADTSFIIALINEKDQYHKLAEALSYKFGNAYLITTSAVLLEIGNALSKSYKIQAIEVIKSFQTTKNAEVVRVNNELFQKGFELYQKYQDKKWGLVDCISFVVMWEKGITEVLTFDEDFKQAGFIILKE